jgi:SAM-dependent methyltransferase
VVDDPKLPDDRVHHACVSCGSTALRPLPTYQADRLVGCRRCGLTFAGRRPTEGELEAHYSGYGDWPDSELTRARYREVLTEFEPYRSSGRIFEMGAGAGYFLEEAAATGWEPHGSTVGELSIQICRNKGLDVVSAADVLATFPEGHFDVATAFEVVEHVSNPGSEAQMLARVLRPGGLLYCTTPNFDSLTRRLLGPRWRVISYPEHLVYFTASTLANWLEPYGFRPLSIGSTGISPGELRRVLRQRRGETPMSPTPSGAGAVRGLDDRLRDATESGRLMPSVKRAVNEGLSRAGLGDTLKGWFVRAA